MDLHSLASAFSIGFSLSFRIFARLLLVLSLTWTLPNLATHTSTLCILGVTLFSRCFAGEKLFILVHHRTAIFWIFQPIRASSERSYGYCTGGRSMVIFRIPAVIADPEDLCCSSSTASQKSESTPSSPYGRPSCDPNDLYMGWNLVWSFNNLGLSVSGVVTALHQ